MALLAEHPANGVNHVGLSATVGAHDTGSAITAESNHGAFAERLKANDFHFSQLKQGVPFCRKHPLRDALPHILRLNQAVKGPGRYRAKRDDFPFLEGRFFGATFLLVRDRNHTRLAGSQSEAQPPGAKMAVREKRVSRQGRAVKAYSIGCGHFPHATRAEFPKLPSAKVVWFSCHHAQTAVIHDPLAAPQESWPGLLFYRSEGLLAQPRWELLDDRRAEHL